MKSKKSLNNFVCIFSCIVMKFSISFLKICLDLMLFSGDRLKNVTASLLNVSSETFPFWRHSLYQSIVSLLLGCSWCCSFEWPIFTGFKGDTEDEYAATFTFHQNCIDHIQHCTMWLSFQLRNFHFYSMQHIWEWTIWALSLSLYIWVWDDCFIALLVTLMHYASTWGRVEPLWLCAPQILKAII